MSDSKLFKKRQVVLGDESFVLNIPKSRGPKQDETGDAVSPDLADALTANGAASKDGDGGSGGAVLDGSAGGADAALSEEDRAFMLSEAEKEAQSIVAEAKKTSESIILEAYDKAEEIKASARDEGYANGVARAESEYEEKVDEAKQELGKIKEELLAERQKLFANAESEMVEMVMDAVDKMIGSRVEGDEELALSLVSNAVKNLTKIGSAVVRLCERDMPLSDKIKTKLEYGSEYIENVEVKLDASLQPGQCVVETDRGNINASLDLQLDKFREQMRAMMEDK